jgi:hypothetical protein
MTKKKLFLIKKVPKAWKDLLYWRNPAFRKVDYISRRSSVAWLADHSLSRGWLKRLADQTNNYFVRLRRRYIMYRFKKQFKNLNKYNRRAIKKLFFPKLSNNELTRFFTITKLTPKAQLTFYLLRLVGRAQNPLSWLVSQEALNYFKYWWYVWHLVKDSWTQCAANNPRTQLPVSTKLLRRMVWYWNSEKRGYSRNNKDFLGYKKWRENSRLWGREYKRVLLPAKRYRRRRYFRFKYYQHKKGIKFIWNTNISKRRSRRHRSTPVNNKQTTRLLDGGCMYDYRSLHEVQVLEKLTTPSTAHKIPDLNLLNFRSFNWFIIT